MNLIVAGGSDFNDWEVFKRSMDRVTLDYSPSLYFLWFDVGECDRMVRRYADEKKVQCWPFRIADSIPYQRAVELRNMEVVSNADGAVLFWDGKSFEFQNLLHILDYCRRRTLVFDYYGNIMLNREY